MTRLVKEAILPCTVVKELALMFEEVRLSRYQSPL